MKRELALEISRVTEAAALASEPWIGRGDKNKADKAAVDAMRTFLNSTEIDGEVIIGEGEIDEAPMLYIGEKVGKGGDKVEIAVDPIDGTRMVALGQDNAVAVMVVATPGTLLKAPDMYMEKLMVNHSAKGSIDLNLPILENVKNVAKKLNKDITEITLMTLAKPRHEEVIKQLQEVGVKILAIPDGDVAGSIKVAMPEENIDIFYGIGGAPEGVISAAIMKCLNGDMQARLVTRSECKGHSNENDAHSKIELERCSEIGIDTSKVLDLNDLCNSYNIVMSITGITDGTLLSGVKKKGDFTMTETILIRGKTRTIRRINSTHIMKLKNLHTK